MSVGHGAIVIERHNRPLSPLFLSLFRSSRSIELVAKPSWASMGGWAAWGWKSRIRKSESQQRPARLFVLSDWPSNTLPLEYFKDHRVAAVSSSNLQSFIIKTDDLFDVFVESRGSMMPISALRELPVIDTGHLATLAIATMKSSF